MTYFLYQYLVQQLWSVCRVDSEVSIESCSSNERLFPLSPLFDAPHPPTKSSVAADHTPCPQLYPAHLASTVSNKVGPARNVR